MKLKILTPSADKLPLIKELLRRSGLPWDDIDPHFGNFLIAENEDSLLGCIGLEKYGKAALLRSFAVNPDFRDLGIGSTLFDKLLSDCLEGGVSELYLLTETAELWFAKKGFQKCDRLLVPNSIGATAEFTRLCPQSAVCMKYAL